MILYYTIILYRRRPDTVEGWYNGLHGLSKLWLVRVTDPGRITGAEAVCVTRPVTATTAAPPRIWPPQQCSPEGEGGGGGGGGYERLGRVRSMLHCSQAVVLCLIPAAP